MLSIFVVAGRVRPAIATFGDRFRAALIAGSFARLYLIFNDGVEWSHPSAGAVRQPSFFVEDDEDAYLFNVLNFVRDFNVRRRRVNVARCKGIREAVRYAILPGVFARRFLRVVSNLEGQEIVNPSFVLITLAPSECCLARVSNFV